jgi:hypothetical protein
VRPTSPSHPSLPSVVPWKVWRHGLGLHDVGGRVSIVHLLHTHCSPRDKVATLPPSGPVQHGRSGAPPVRLPGPYRPHQRLLRLAADCRSVAVSPRSTLKSTPTRRPAAPSFVLLTSCAGKGDPMVLGLVAWCPAWWAEEAICMLHRVFAVFILKLTDYVHGGSDLGNWS